VLLGLKKVSHGLLRVFEFGKGGTTLLQDCRIESSLRADVPEKKDYIGEVRKSAEEWKGNLIRNRLKRQVSFKGGLED